MADGSHAGAFSLARLLVGFTDDAPVPEGEKLGASQDEAARWLGAVAHEKDTRKMLSRLANVNPHHNNPSHELIRRLSSISKQVMLQTGRIEGEYLRRPNTLCAYYGTALAPAGTQAFSVQPGVGNSYYRLLGFLADDDQAGVFGFQSLKVGGQEHVQMSQSTPAAPVTNAVPWTMFMLREHSLKTNLAPWSGQVFDQSTPVTGTCVNMTVAATADAVTLAPRLTFLTQTDPCGMRYEQIKNASGRYWTTMRGNLDAYAPLLSHA